MSTEQGSLLPTGPINMGDVEVPSVNYIEPGMYSVTVKEVKFEVKVGKKQGATPKPVMTIVFMNGEGKEYSENFYLAGDTPDKSKTMLGRIQYLHEAVFGEKVTETFTTYEQIKAYYETKLTSRKCPEIRLIVGGEEQEDGKVYSRLGFTDFIFKGEKAEFVEGPFPKDSEAYKKAVTKKKTTTAGKLVQTSAAPVLNPSVAGTGKAPWEAAVN